MRNNVTLLFVFVLRHLPLLSLVFFRFFCEFEDFLLNLQPILYSKADFVLEIKHKSKQT